MERRENTDLLDRSESDKELSFFGDIIGFYGSGGNILDSLGVYYIDC